MAQPVTVVALQLWFAQPLFCGKDGKGLPLSREQSLPSLKDITLTLRKQVNSACFLPWKTQQVQRAAACVLLVKQGFVQRPQSVSAAQSALAAHLSPGGFWRCAITSGAQLSERWPLPLLYFQDSWADGLSVIKHWAIQEKPNLYWQHGWFGTTVLVPGLQDLDSGNVKNEFLVCAGEIMIWATSLLTFTRLGV